MPFFKDSEEFKLPKRRGAGVGALCFFAGSEWHDEREREILTDGAVARDAKRGGILLGDKMSLCKGGKYWY